MMSLRRATLDDYEEIAQLESGHGLTPLSREVWTHLWLGNPVYSRLRENWPVGWVLQNGDGRIAGSIGNIPLMFELGGRTILAASGRAWVASPDCRGMALALLDNVVNQPGIDLFVNNTVNALAVPAMDAFGCQRVPSGVWDHSAFWITRHRPFLESALRGTLGPLSRPLSYPLAALTQARDWLAVRMNPPRPGDILLSSGFDDRFDEFWEAAKRRASHTLLAHRNRDALEWHFKDAMRNGSVWIATVPGGARLSAYAVFVCGVSRKSGFRRVRLVDFQSLQPGNSLLYPLLSWALQKCREEGFHVLECTGTPLEDRSLLRRFGPWRRRLSSWSYYYRANNPQLAELLRNPLAWNPSPYDGDASLAS